MGNGFVSLVGLEVPIAGEVGSAWAEAPRAFVSVGVWAGRAPGRPGSGAGAPRNGEARKAALFRPENVRVFQKRAGRPGGGPAAARCHPGSVVSRCELGPGLGAQTWGARVLSQLSSWRPGLRVFLILSPAHCLPIGSSIPNLPFPPDPARSAPLLGTNLREKETPSPPRISPLLPQERGRRGERSFSTWVSLINLRSVGCL